MTEQLVPITPEEQEQRNKLLRGKRRGIRLVMVMLAMACSGILYFLQYQEKTDQTTLLQVSGVLTVILFIGVFCYWRFAKLINQDMQSNEKILTIGTVIRSNFIGNNIYQTRVYGRGNQKYLTLEVNGRWVTLSGSQLKRALPEVYQLNHVRLRDQFELEFTPFGRHLMRANKL